MPNNQGGYAPYSVPLGQQPDCRTGRKSINVPIDFSLGSSFKLDLSQVQSQGAIDCVQTLFVDLRNATAGNLQITMGLSNQVIELMAGSQAYIPVLQGNPPVLNFVISTGTPTVNIQLLNFFVPPCVWYTAGFPVSDTTLAAIIQNGAANVNANPVTVSNPTDASGTITAGGTPQQVFAANAARKRFIVSNPSTATEVLQLAYGNTGHYIDLPPGMTWVEADFSVSGDAIFLNAATTGHAFTAYAW